MIGVRTRPAAAGSGPAPATEPTGQEHADRGEHGQHARRLAPPETVAKPVVGTRQMTSSAGWCVTVGGCVRTRSGSPPGRLPARRGRAQAIEITPPTNSPPLNTIGMAYQWPCERCCEVRVQHLHSRPGASGFPGRSSSVPVRVGAWSPAANGAVSAARLARWARIGPPGLVEECGHGLQLTSANYLTWVKVPAQKGQLPAVSPPCVLLGSDGEALRVR
jgi:hypothetical protein